MDTGGWIHISHATVLGFYWGVTAVALINGLLDLVRLKRLDEKHHLYWGSLLVLLTFLPMPMWFRWAVRLFGTEMIVDDSLNHAVQVADVDDGKAPRPDWTWDHRIGAWIMLKLGWKS